MNPAAATISHLKEVVAESPNKHARAKWDTYEVSILCHYATEAVELKLVDAGSLNKKGWKHVWDNFVPCFGRKYQMGQLKTKWRHLGRQYKLWKALLGQTTGLGSDDEMGTLIADDDWWKSCIEENPDFKQIRYQTVDQYRELERIFAPLRDFSKFGRAATNFNSDMDIETVGNGAEGEPSEDFSMSQSTIEGRQNSNINAPSKDMEAEADRPTGGRPTPTSGPSSSRSSKLPRSLFTTPEFAHIDKRRNKRHKKEEHMERMAKYLTTGAKDELDKYVLVIRDPFDLGIVMKAVAELPDFTFGGASWMEALHYFERTQWACTSFLIACTKMEMKLEYTIMLWENDPGTSRTKMM